nr:hypothetical protein CDS [Bradyrhizobium sp.]
MIWLFVSLRNDGAVGHLMLLLLDSRCHVPIAIPADFAAARAIARIGGGVLARYRVAIVRGVFRNGFLARTVLCRYGPCFGQSI